MTGTAQPELGKYVLLTSRQRQYATPSLVVAVADTQRGVDIPIEIFAPGLNGADMAKLRFALQEGLTKALVGRNDGWVCDIELEGGQVVVCINDYDAIPRGKTVRAVLSEVYNQLLPLEQLAWREILVVQRHELLVVVPWNEPDTLSGRGLDFSFPAELQLEGGEDGPDDLESRLSYELRRIARETTVHIFVPHHGEQAGELQIQVSFSNRAQLHDGIYNAVIRKVIAMVTEHSSTPRRVGRLRFVPQSWYRTSQEEAGDDDFGPYDEF